VDRLQELPRTRPGPPAWDAPEPGTARRDWTLAALLALVALLLSLALPAVTADPPASAVHVASSEGDRAPAR
jgi:hypothetical protein